MADETAKSARHFGTRASAKKVVFYLVRFARMLCAPASVDYESRRSEISGSFARAKITSP